jgi:hypothetical protein
LIQYPTITGNKTLYHIVSRLFLAGLFLLLFSASTDAQVKDSTAADTIVHRHSPRKAVIYSLICPGLGQIYNRKYWKIPFIYGAGGTLLYYVGFNQLEYKKFRDANDIGKAGETTVIDGYTWQYEDLERGRDWYRRYRDLSIAGLAAIYLLNVIDAMVDAHFFYYDVSDDLSMKLEPALIQSPGITASVGLRINLGF